MVEAPVRGPDRPVVGVPQVDGLVLGGHGQAAEEIQYFNETLYFAFFSNMSPCLRLRRVHLWVPAVVVDGLARLHAHARGPFLKFKLKFFFIKLKIGKTNLHLSFYLKVGETDFEPCLPPLAGRISLVRRLRLPRGRRARRGRTCTPWCRDRPRPRSAA